MISRPRLVQFTRAALYSTLHRSGAALAFLGCLACGDRAAVQADATSAIRTRDSAGVSIVEHGATLIQTLPEWTIDTIPVLRISGDENTFTGIQDVVGRPDGGVLVFDDRLQDVRQFSPDGAFERVVARSGQGPGEVSRVERMQFLAGDTLVVFDARQRRASIFDPDGSYLRQINYPRTTGSPRLAILSVLDDSRWFVSLKPIVPPPEEIDGHMHRSEFTIAIVAPERSATSGTEQASAIAVETVASALEREEFAAPFTDRSDTRLEYYNLVFGRNSFVAAAGNTVFVGTNERNEIMVYDKNRLVRIIRDDTQPAAVESDDRKRYEDELLELFLAMKLPSSETVLFREELRQYRYASTLPFYDNLLAGEDSTLWVERPRASRTQAREYVLYNVDGEATARVVLPAGIKPFRVDRNQILGTYTRDDSVPDVLVWRLRPITEP